MAKLEQGSRYSKSMPIKKIDDTTWEVGGEEFDSEEKAEKAYQAILALKLGVDTEKKKKKKEPEEEE